MDLQNRVRNATMAKAKKTALAYFPVTSTWRSLILIDIPVVDPQNEFKEARSSTALYDRYVQVPVKHDFSETFYREKFDGFFLEKVSGIILLII